MFLTSREHFGINHFSDQPTERRENRTERLKPAEEESLNTTALRPLHVCYSCCVRACVSVRACVRVCLGSSELKLQLNENSVLTEGRTRTTALLKHFTSTVLVCV